MNIKPDYKGNWKRYKNDRDLYSGRIDLFSKTRNIYNYVTRAVDVNASLIFKGVAVVGDDQKLIEIINAVYSKADWSKVARYMAALGDSVIKIETDGKKKQISVKHMPTENCDWAVDEDGRVIYAKYAYKSKEIGGLTEIVEEYWPEKIVISKNGQAAVEEVNEYGFVPFYILKYKDIGEKYSENAYNHVINSVDILNVLASFLNEISKKMADPLYVLNGDQKKTTEAIRGLSKNIAEGVNVLQLAEGMDFKIVEGGTDNFPNLLAYLDKIDQNIKLNLPELALADLKTTDASGYALSLMLHDLIAKIEEVRGNVGRTLENMNQDIRSILVDWGLVSENAENYTEVKFAPVFDFSRIEKIEEVKTLLDLGLITEEIARQMLGIEWSGFDNNQNKEEEISQKEDQEENQKKKKEDNDIVISKNDEENKGIIIRIIEWLRMKLAA